MGNKDLPPEQFAAIRKGIELGTTLQKDYGQELVGLWIEHCSYESVAEILGISEEYSVSGNVGRNGVYKAIVGHDGSFNLQEYDGLIPEEEWRRLGGEHKDSVGIRTYEEGLGVHGRTHEQHAEDGRRGGIRTHEEGLGIFARTPEQLAEQGRKGGVISGHKAYEEGLGIFARTPEQHVEHARKGGRKVYEEKLGIHGLTPEQRTENARKGIITKGLIPWAEEELTLAYELSQLPEYRHGSKISNIKIAKELNRVMHDGEQIRSAKTVGVYICRYRKSLSSNLLI